MSILAKRAILEALRADGKLLITNKMIEDFDKDTFSKFKKEYKIKQREARYNQWLLSW
jgi:hypothetical protein